VIRSVCKSWNLSSRRFPIEACSFASAIAASVNDVARTNSMSSGVTEKRKSDVHNGEVNCCFSFITVMGYNQVGKSASVLPT
jgi:hypothetical protein